MIVCVAVGKQESQEGEERGEGRERKRQERKTKVDPIVKVPLFMMI